MRDERVGAVLPVLVANQLDPGLRRELEAAGWGWLDRSGHLRMFQEGLQVDRRIPSLVGPQTAPIDPLARPTGLAVALCLSEGVVNTSVRALAAAAGISTGAAHSAMTELTTLGLAEDGRRRDPDLFWAVAARWATRWHALGSGPGPGIPASVQRLLRFAFDDPAAQGWAEVGDRIAQAFGARVAGEGPPDALVGGVAVLVHVQGHRVTKTSTAPCEPPRSMSARGSRSWPTSNSRRAATSWPCSPAVFPSTS